MSCCTVLFILGAAGLVHLFAVKYDVYGKLQALYAEVVAKVKSLLGIE